MALSTSDFAGDGTRIRNFRHGEAPEEERELKTFVPLPNEVQLIRKSDTRIPGTWPALPLQEPDGDDPPAGFPPSELG